MKNSGIALKLTIFVLASVLVIFSFVLSYNYIVSREIIIGTVEKDAHHLALATVNRIDAVLRGVEKIPENMAGVLECVPCQGGEIVHLARSMVENNPDIYGGTIAFEPYAYSPNSLTFAPYFYRKDGRTEFTYIPYEYFQWDWYQIPKELARPTWTEPYYDEGAGEIIMSTYAVPFYRDLAGERKFMGVVTADISLAGLRNIVDSIKIARTGYGFLISKNGTFITHPDSSLVMNETIFSVAETMGDARIRELGREMIHGRSGFAPFRSIMTGKDCWMVYAPLASNGWSLGVLFPRVELMADITRLNHTAVFLSLAGFLFVLVVIMWIARSITRPLRALSRATEEIGTGNLDVPLPRIASRDEVGRLAEAFAYMKDSLKTYIRELTETTAAKERIESELKIAHDIQMGILPKIFPPFPNRREFDIYATLEPAKEVGGDLYDFFFMDEDLLCFALGDVSGKGVPAALFMAVAKTLIKTKATQGLAPHTVLSRVNEDLSLDNPSCMFATLFLGILNVRTGDLEYANGGHNPPYLMPPQDPIEPLASTGGLALGVMEEFTYQSKRIALHKGDTLFLFTDGVTEAVNGNQEMFSEQRLVEDLASLRHRPVQDIVGGVMEKLRAFSRGEPQFDDITIMALRFLGPQG
ncbi:MAG: SpoIIE family protein phosphatase [Deltaproteobacteria bacterium]|nr:SpoIIE family protein phosphatase [Deltaproteobacteria bacterium]